jgi:CubicO group peptidase (beta-lactamase class C family)
MRTRLIALVVCLGVAWPVTSAMQAPVAPTSAAITSTVTGVFNAWDVPSAAVAVVKDGQVVLSQGYGGKTDDLTSFYTASVTKTFTVAALGMLADEGKLRIDDPVVKYLPDFATADPTLSAQLTVRDLMAHRTGLPRADLLMFAGLSDREVIGRLKGIAPIAPLRTRLTYQNQMYLALGEIVARLSGKPWSQFVTERVLTPLGMTHSSAAGLGHTPSGTTAVQPHARVDGKVSPVSLVPRPPYGAGGITSTGRDMAAWLQFLLGDGTWNGAKLLNPQVINATRQPQIVTPPIYMYPDAVLSSYGLGWFLSDYHGHLIVQHGGNGEGWTALVFLQPDVKLGVAVMTNMNSTLMPWAIAYSIADAYSGRTTRDWTKHYLTAERARDAAQAKQIPVAADGTVDAATWAGTYTSPVYGELRIVPGGAGVELHYGTALHATLRPVAGGGVAAFWHRSDITAVIGPSIVRQTTAGAGTRLSLVLGGDTIEFIRTR